MESTMAHWSNISYVSDTLGSYVSDTLGSYVSDTLGRYQQRSSELTTELTLKQNYKTHSNWSSYSQYTHSALPQNSTISMILKLFSTTFCDAEAFKF